MTISISVIYFRGAVVTAECAEKVIKKDMIDPINGKKMTESDFIYIQRVGTNDFSFLLPLKSTRYINDCF